MPVNDITGARVMKSISPQIGPDLIRDRQHEDRITSLEQRALLLAPQKVDIQLYGSWSNYGGGYQPLSAFRSNGIIYLYGLVAKNSTTNQSQVALLPVGQRPANRHIFTNIYAQSTETFTRIDVAPDGYVYFVTGNPAATVGYLSLSGINFPVAT